MFPSIMRICEDIAAYAKMSDLYLRSGGAPGCDDAFHRGAGARSEIYLPNDGFNNHSLADGHEFRLLTDEQSKKAELITEQFHKKPKPKSYTGWWNLMNRNACQVLGPDLMDATVDERSQFVVCWTSTGLDTGGTSQAIRIARYLEIPVFNIYHKDQLEGVYRMIDMIRF